MKEALEQNGWYLKLEAKEALDRAEGDFLLCWGWYIVAPSDDDDESIWQHDSIPGIGHLRVTGDKALELAREWHEAAARLMDDH